jgi:putative ABC transport system permease protein
MLQFNLKIALRNIWKNKVYSSVNIIGLALSMACCLVISVFIWNELHYDDFHTNRDNIYRLTEKQNQAGTIYDVAVTPGLLAPALQKDFPEIVNTVRFQHWSGNLKNGLFNFQEKEILVTDNNVFEVFNFPLLLGDSKTALTSVDDIVITERIAEKYFGKDWRSNPSVLGQIFTLNNKNVFKVAGIAQNPPENSSIQFDVLLPFTYVLKVDEWSNKWGSNNFHTYLQLKQGTDITDFSEKIKNQLHSYSPKRDDLMQLQPLKAQYLYSKFDFQTDWGKRSNIKYVKIFAGVGLLLLLIACVNFINLSTARSLKRSLEVGVRKVNGASRKQLVFQFLCESFLMAVIAGMAAILILQVLNSAIQILTNKAIVLHFSSGLFMGSFLLVIFIIGIVAGIYPAFVLSGFKPVKNLKNNDTKKSRNYIQQGLVVFQFGISITLMICSFMMYRQLQFIQQKDLGFNKEQLINVRLNGALKEKSDVIKQDLENQSCIAAAAPATMSLVNVDNSTYLEWDGMQEADKFLITQANVTPDFILTLGIKLRAGRNFLPQKTTDTINHFIINETAVKRMGYTSNDKILGKLVTFYGAKGYIIGVVKDFHFKSLNADIEPFIFRYQPWAAYFTLFVKTVEGKTAEAIHQIQKVYKKYDAETPVEFSFVDEAINDLYKNDKRTATIIALFAGLTIFVGCLGLFGLAVFSAEQRIKEIGIRKVLGASVPNIVQLLSKDFVKLVFVSIVIASPIAYYVMHKWLQDFAYRIDISWGVFALAGFLALLIALLTVSFQAVKAAVANPVKSLRTE